MHRRHFIMVLIALLASAIACWRFGVQKPVPVASDNDRVVFVCRDKFGRHSIGVYLHGPDGGGPACLDFARLAAHSLRSGEPDDSAAGLCGWLFKEFGDDVASGGGLSLMNRPTPAKDGKVDWDSYCPGEVDLVLINIDEKTAECYVTQDDEGDSRKALVARLEGLKIP